MEKTPLFHLEPLSDLYVDACLRDGAGNLLFLSCVSRDTSLQQLFSAFSLPQSQGGLENFHLRGDDGRRHLVNVGDDERLGKLTGRLPRDNLFGNLVHAWVFDKALQQPDYSNRVAWLVDRKTALVGERLEQRIWDLYKLLSPVPLLEHWRDTLLRATKPAYVQALDDSTFPPLGDITAYRIHLGDLFLETVSAMVKGYKLTLNHSTPAERLAA
jgi:hypothetical protein